MYGRRSDPFLGFAPRGGVNLNTDHPIVAPHVRHMARLKRVRVMTYCTDVGAYIIRRVPNHNMVDNFVTYTMAGCSNFPLLRVAIRFKYKILTGTTNRFGPGRPNKIL